VHVHELVHIGRLRRRHHSIVVYLVGIRPLQVADKLMQAVVSVPLIGHVAHVVLRAALLLLLLVIPTTHSYVLLHPHRYPRLLYVHTPIVLLLYADIIIPGGCHVHAGRCLVVIASV
jgi:hypothetical protein